jgi:leucyl-tRNA synthetase
MIDKYGTDTVRLFCMFAAPPEKDLEWSDQGVDGAYRFLNRLWTVVQKNIESLKVNVSIEGIDYDQLDNRSLRLLRKTHQTIKRVTNNIERNYHFNTAIAALMELINEIVSFNPASAEDRNILYFSIQRAVLLLAPFAPHVAEEVWRELDGQESIFREKWPEWDEQLIKEAEIELVIQINGKLRSKVMIPAGLDDDTIRESSLRDPRVSGYVGNKPIKKIIVVKGKLVNIVL